jgi:hypothetical protein
MQSVSPYRTRNRIRPSIEGAGGYHSREAGRSVAS